MIKWVTLDDYANSAQENYETIKKRIQRDPTRYRVRTRPGVGRGGRVIEIALEDNKSAISNPSSLILSPLQGELCPTGGTANMAGEQLINPAELSEKAVDRLVEKTNIIEFIKGQTGTLQERLVMASVHHHRPLKTIERWWYTYNKEGLVGLLDGYGNRSGASKVEQTHLEYAVTLYAQRPAPPYTHVFQCVRKKFPEIRYSLSSFKDRFEAIFPPVYTDFFRMDHKEWRDRYRYFCQRDYSTLLPNDIICMDSRLWDIFTYPDEAKIRDPKRFWKVAARDLATGRFTGWSFCENSSSQAILSALRHSILRCGIPKAVYVDNGLDYQSKRVQALVEDVLKIQVITAIPYEPQSKPVESSFNIIRQEFERYQPGWCGHDNKDRPDKLDLEIAEKRLMNIRELEEKFERWMWSWERQKNEARGEAPIDRWKGFNAEVISDERVLDVLMLDHKPTKVRGGGIVTIERTKYQSPSLYHYIGKSVEVFWDPQSMKTVQVYLDNQWICDASIDELMTMNPTKEMLRAAGRKISQAKRMVKDMNETFRVSNMDISGVMMNRYQHVPDEEVLEIGKRTRPAPEELAVERVVSGDMVTETSPDGSVLQYERTTDPELLAQEQDPNARFVRRLPEVERMIRDRTDRTRIREEVEKLDLDPATIWGGGRRRNEELEINTEDLLRPRK